MIVCKKFSTSSDIEWQRVTTSDNKWYNEWQWVTTSDIEWYNEWQREIQRVTTSCTARDNEWQRMTTSNKKWQWVTENDSEWWNKWIRMRVSKIEWFYVSRKTKGQSGRPFRSQNNFIQFCMQYVITIRISRSQMFFEIGVLKVYNIHRETPVLEPLFSQTANLKAYKFIKKRLQHRCFPVNITNLLRI